MSKRIGGPRRGTRRKFSKNIRQKGKISTTRYIQEFKKGDNVVLCAEPAVQKSLYHQRHHGRQGVVQKKIGKCYEILIRDINKEKKVIVHPVHLKKA